MKKRLFTLCALLLCTAMLAAPVSAAEETAKAGEAAQSAQATQAAETTETGEAAQSDEAAATVDTAPLTAYDYYEKAANNLDKAKSVEYKGSFRTTVSAESLGADVDVTGSMLTRMVKQADGSAHVYSATKAGEVTSFAYFKDGYNYIKQGNEKYKYTMNMEEMMAQYGPQLDDVEKGWFNRATITEEEGGRRILFTVSGQELKELMEMVQDSVISEDMKSVYDNISYDGLVYNMLIGYDDQLKDQKMTYHFSMKADDEVVKMQMVMYMKVSAINTFNKIDFPTDLDSYQLLDISELNAAEAEAETKTENKTEAVAV